MKISRCLFAFLWAGIACGEVESLQGLGEGEPMNSEMEPRPDQRPPVIPPTTPPTEPDPKDEVVQPQMPGQFVCSAEAPVAPSGFVLQPGVDCEAIANAVPGGRRRYQPSQPDASCGAGASNYVEFAYNRDAYDLHVVAVYEPDEDEGGSIIEVQVGRSERPIVLALTSYDSVTWDLQVAADANIEAVLLHSYNASQVVGTTAPVHSIDWSTVCGGAHGWELERNQGGGNFEDFQMALRAITGLTERSFQGCYAASKFVVPFHESCATIQPTATVNGDETVVPGKTTFTQCPALDNDAHVCMTARGPSLELVGVESGNTCPLRSLPASPANDQGMWWHGEVLYACTSKGLLRSSLVDSTYEILNIDCAGIGEVGGEIWMFPAMHSGSRQVFKYADIDGLYTATGQGLPRPISTVSRYSLIGDSIYGVWHSSDEVMEQDAQGVQYQHGLGGHDGWVNAMSVTEDGLMIFQDHYSNVWSLQLGSQVLAPSNLSRASARACIQWQ